MRDIRQIDENFRSQEICVSDLRFYNCLEQPFEINGLYQPRQLQKYTRMPDAYRENPALNEGMRQLMSNTSGGRIRFATNSPYLAVLVELEALSNIPHMAATGHSGVDVYICQQGKSDYAFRKICIPNVMREDADRFYKAFMFFRDFDDFEAHEVMLNLPLYNGVNAVYVGIQEDCRIFAPVEYRVKKPVYFYGPSTTQGGCASRPGNNYPNHVSRWLNCDFVNLGFSGTAAAEPEMAEYLARQDASAIVLELDMRLRDIEVFRQAFGPFYQKIRQIASTVPLILMSFPKFPKIHHTNSNFRDHVLSNRIIMETCVGAWNNGDENLWYIDGETLFGDWDQDACTVDYSHPNDLGFYRIAQRLYPVLKRALEISERQ